MSNAATPLDSVSAALVLPRPEAPKLVQQTPPVDPASAVLAALGKTTPKVHRVEAPALDDAREEWITPLNRVMNDERFVEGGPLGPSPAFRMPPAPRATADRGTDDQGSSWGRTLSPLLVGESPEALRVVLEKSEPLTLTLSVPQSPGITAPDINGNQTILSVWAVVTWGSGSSTSQRMCRVDAFGDTPLVCSFLSVKCYLAGPDGNPNGVLGTVGPANFAQVACWAARGVRGLPYNLTNFVTDEGVNFRLTQPQAVRTMSIAAHLATTAAGQRFLQLFDSAAPGPTPINNGATPTEEWALGAAPSPGLPRERWLCPRGWALGVCAAVSTTSGTLTVAGESAWVSLEVLGV